MRSALAAVVLALTLMQARAQELPLVGGPPPADTAPTGPVFSPFVDETVTVDDNVFRISDRVNPLTIINYPARSDTSLTTAVGVTADVPFGLQRIQASLAYDTVHYNRFRDLDYDGYDLHGTWLWRLGRSLSGEVGVTDTYSLEPFADLLEVRPDKLHLREEFAHGSWLITPDWKLYLGADDLTQSNSDPLGQYNDVTVDSFEGSISRLGGAGDWIGLDGRFETGRFPVGEPVFGSITVNNNYNQYGGGLVVDWGEGTPSRVVARVDEIGRRYQELPQRDLNLTTARIEYTWTPSVKTLVSLIAERDISPYEYVRSSLVLVKGIILHPLWHATPKIDVSAELGAVSRSYLADPLITVGLEPARVDKFHVVEALLTYNPIEHLTLALSATHEQRSSNVEFGDYLDTNYWFKVRFAL
jgi:hypothetical protein